MMKVMVDGVLEERPIKTAAHFPSLKCFKQLPVYDIDNEVISFKHDSDIPIITTVTRRVNGVFVK